MKRVRRVRRTKDGYEEVTTQYGCLTYIGWFILLAFSVSIVIMHWYLILIVAIVLVLGQLAKLKGRK